MINENAQRDAQRVATQTIMAIIEDLIKDAGEKDTEALTGFKMIAQQMSV